MGLLFLIKSQYKPHKIHKNKFKNRILTISICKIKIRSLWVLSGCSLFRDLVHVYTNAAPRGNKNLKIMVFTQTVKMKKLRV